MTSVVLTKELLVRLSGDAAARARFPFLDTIANYLRRMRDQQTCGVCRHRAVRPVELDDALFEAVLDSPGFSARAADLAGYLAADLLLLPGRREPVRARSR